MRTLVAVPLVAAAIASAQNGGAVPRHAVEGIAVLVDRPPKPEPVEVALDVEACGKKKVKPGLTVSRKGGIRDAVVAFEPAPAGDPPAPTTVVVDQKRCEYVPHVAVAPAGSKVTFTNNDAVVHNVHVLSPADPMNKAQPKGVILEKTFARPGLYPVKCDFHHWMSAYVYVVPHRYAAVTDVNGRFRIPDVPAGKHTLRLWHEVLGTWDLEIEVPLKAPAKFELPLPGK